MLERRHAHAAVALSATQVLACGGFDPDADPTVGPSSTCEHFDLQQRKWLPGLPGLPEATMPSGRMLSSMTRLGEPEAPWSVLVAGGMFLGSPVPGHLIGDVEGWEEVTEPEVSRRFHTASLLSDGSVLLVGGKGEAGALATQVQRRHADGTWTTAGEQARYLHTATVLPSGDVVVVGGFDENGAALSDVQLYSMQENEWKTLAPLPVARGYHTATLLPDQSLLIVGGTASFDLQEPIESAGRYHVAEQRWEDANPDGDLVPRVRHRAALLHGCEGPRRDEGACAYAVVAGGLVFEPSEDSFEITASVQVYDPRTNSWSDLLPLTVPRDGFELTPVGDRTLLASGGSEVADVRSADLLEPLGLGEACGAGNECVSGACVDGTCCNTSCSGPCRTCANDTGECVELDGAPAEGREGCGEYACAAGECRTDCTDDAHCALGHYCAGGACVPRAGQGASCATSRECADGLFCADGVCCDAPCEGQCEACDAKGTCRAVRGQPVGGRPPCDASGHEDCRAECDGISRVECVYPGAARACGRASCEDGVETHVGTCDGTGQCEQATLSCEGYACSGNVCRRSCANDTDCTDAHHCDEGRCVPNCGGDDDCDPGESCYQGRCVAPRCSPDLRVVLKADGTEEDCHEYVCNWRTQQCLTRCETNWDCAPGYYCSASAKCLESPLFDGSLGGCSVGPPGRVGAQRSVALLGLVIAAGAGLLRSRRRRV